MIRISFIALLLFISPAQASYPCWMVKVYFDAYFQKHEMKKAEQWARSKGVTEQDIEAARKCLVDTGK